MQELIIKENENIKDKIHMIRGVQVILDSDLATLYDVETKQLNRQVKRNIERFDDDFMFQLTKEESEELSRCQNGTLKLKQGYNIKYLPYVFTELGVSAAASVLHSDTAIKMSKDIIRAFVAMRHYLGDNEYRLLKAESKLLEHDSSIKMLETAFDNFKCDKEVDELYFDGKIYDAYSKILDVFNEATDELIVVDRYVDKTFLDMVKNIKASVVLITSKNSKLTRLDIQKYNATYDNLNIYYSEVFHDRYIIIDKKKIYHSGNSINHIGYRKSSIDLINDYNIKEAILKDIKTIIENK